MCWSRRTRRERRETEYSQSLFDSSTNVFGSDSSSTTRSVRLSFHRKSEYAISRATPNLFPSRSQEREGRGKDRDIPEQRQCPELAQRLIKLSLAPARRPRVGSDSAARAQERLVVAFELGSGFSSTAPGSTRTRRIGRVNIF
jgi:hypothetical protein